MRGLGKRASVCTLAATAAIGLAACGDDDDSTTAASDDSTTATEASTDTVTVTATEYDFALDPGTPTTDTKSIEFVNDGKEFHVMVLARINEGFTLDEAVKLEGEKGSADLIAEAEAAPGETSEAKFRGEIVPGDNYAMLCPVGGKDGPHYKLGQLEEFSVE